MYFYFKFVSNDKCLIMLELYNIHIKKEINVHKTKYMTITRILINKRNLITGQYTFEQVDNFKYLGVNRNANSNMH